MSSVGTNAHDLPYRPCVGAVLFSRAGQVLVGRRVDRARGTQAAGGDAVWQLPQGGIEPNEDPRDAVFRELGEEIGTVNATIIGEHPDWLTYDLPPHLVGRVLGGRFRGQRQRWFALRFEGDDREIKLDAHPDEIEFDAWKWVDLAELPGLAVAFKAPIYRIIADGFSRFGRTPTAGSEPG